MDDRLLVGGMSDVTKWTILGNDTTNLAQSATFPLGAGLDFDKKDGSDGKKYAGAYRVIAPASMMTGYSILDRLVWPVYVSTVADISTSGFAFVRLGTSSTNYWEFRYAGSSITAARLNICSCPLGNGYLAGVGAKLENMSYMAVGLQLDAEDDTLANIYVGDVYLHKVGIVEDF